MSIIITLFITMGIVQLFLFFVTLMVSDGTTPKVVIWYRCLSITIFLFIVLVAFSTLKAFAIPIIILILFVYWDLKKTKHQSK